MQSAVVSEIRRIRVEIKRAQIESAISGGWVVGLYVGVSPMCLFCRTPAVATQSLIEAGRVQALWFVFAQLLPSADHLTLPTCRCIPPAYLALECLHAGSFLTDGTEETDFQVSMLRYVKPVRKARWNIPYIHLVKRKTESWEVVEQTVYHVQGFIPEMLKFNWCKGQHQLHDAFSTGGS